MTKETEITIVMLMALFSAILIVLFIQKQFKRMKSYKLNKVVIGLYTTTLTMDYHDIDSTIVWLDMNNDYIEYRYADTLLNLLKMREKILDADTSTIYRRR